MLLLLLLLMFDLPKAQVKQESMLGYTKHFKTHHKCFRCHCCCCRRCCQW